MRAATHRAEAVEQRIGAGRHEPRRHDRLDQAGIVRVGPDVVDQRFGPGNRIRRRRVPIERRALVGIVHRHLADEGALARREAGVDEEPGRLGMDGGEIDRRRRAVGEKVGHQCRVDPRGKGRVGVSRLQWKRVFLQPDLQRHVECGAELWILRRMDVKVDETGQHDAVRRHGHELPRALGSVADSRKPCIARGGDRGNVAVLVNGHQRVGEYLDTIWRWRMGKGAGDGLAPNVVHHPCPTPSVTARPRRCRRSPPFP